jgi:hypothetical protein
MMLRLCPNVVLRTNPHHLPRILSSIVAFIKPVILFVIAVSVPPGCYVDIHGSLLDKVDILHEVKCF